MTKPTKSVHVLVKDDDGDSGSRKSKGQIAASVSDLVENLLVNCCDKNLSTLKPTLAKIASVVAVYETAGHEGNLLGINNFRQYLNIINAFVGKLCGVEVTVKVKNLPVLSHYHSRK